MHMATVGPKEKQTHALGLSALAAKISGGASSPKPHTHGPGDVPESLCRICHPELNTPKAKPAEAKNPTTPAPAPATKPQPDKPAPASPAPTQAKAPDAGKGKAKPNSKPTKPASKGKKVTKAKSATKVKATKDKTTDVPRSKYLADGQEQPRGAFTASKTTEAIDMMKRKTGALSSDIQKTLKWNAKRVNRFVKTVVTPLCKLKVASAREGADTRYTIKP